MPNLRFAVAALTAAVLLGAASAAVHPYNSEYFFSVGDAFIFRGGREGLFASKSEVRSAVCEVWLHDEREKEK